MPADVIKVEELAINIVPIYAVNFRCNHKPWALCWELSYVECFSCGSDVRNRGILIQSRVPFWILAFWTMIWLANSITWLSTCRWAPVTMASLTHLLSTCRHVQLMTMASLGYILLRTFMSSEQHHFNSLRCM
jgi:hypothetical protein